MSLWDKFKSEFGFRAVEDTTAAEEVCNTCGRDIEPGETITYSQSWWDGIVQTAVACKECSRGFYNPRVEEQHTIFDLGDIEQAKEQLRNAYMTFDMISHRDDDLLEAAILDIEVARRRLNHEVIKAKQGLRE